MPIAVHATHAFPPGAWFCARCRLRKDDADIGLRCVPLGEDPVPGQRELELS